MRFGLQNQNRTGIKLEYQPAPGVKWASRHAHPTSSSLGACYSSKVGAPPSPETKMTLIRVLFVSTLAFTVLAGNVAVSAGRGQGNGKAKGHDKKEDKHAQQVDGDDDERGHNKHYYKDHDRQVARGWYSQHEGRLPPGLAKKDRLPPGLQKQLDARGTLPPGLQKRLQPVPRDLEVRLSPPPPECSHVLIGGNIVLLNRRTNLVVDIVVFN
jgi:hypothetical protein